MSKEDLRPVRTKEEAKERGRNGGIKSGKVRKEKKLLSQIYSEVLADMYDIDNPDKDLRGIVKKIVKRADKTTVSMLRTMLDATEGKNINVEGKISVNIIDDVD